MKIAIGVAYDGSSFEGWQSQPSGNTVQDHLERALAGIAQQPIRLIAAGRTDAGVHAIGQVAHFETGAVRPDSAWVRGVNALLSPAIAVQWAVQVGDEFNARYSARGRTYRYLLYNHAVRPAVLAGRTGWFHAPLDAAAMRAAAEMLLGEHDFSSFRSAECQAKSPVRVMQDVGIAQKGSYFVFEFTANAFLHHMVRNLVGCLVHVGKGSHPPEWLAQVLAWRDRSRCAPTFAADGLYLAAVNYPESWRLPAFDPMIPLFGTIAGT